LFGATKQDKLKNRHIGGALALGGRRLVKKSNNKQIVGGNERKDVGEGARLGWSVWGGVVSLCRAAYCAIHKIQKSNMPWP
jgi:hypothetical protein